MKARNTNLRTMKSNLNRRGLNTSNRAYNNTAKNLNTGNGGNRFNQYKVPIFVGLVAVVGLFILGLFLGGPFAGQAVSIDAPIIGTLDLSNSEEYIVNVDIPENKVIEDVKLAYASTSALNNLKILTEEQTDSSLKYAIVESSSSTTSLAEVDEALAFGILSDQFSSGPIFMNGDNFADLELTYSNGYLTIKNLGYIHPNTATFKLFNETIAGVREYQNEVTFVNKTKTYRFYVNVSSSTTPVVTVKRTEAGITPSLTAYPAGNNQHLIQVDVVATQAKPYILELSANVGGKITDMAYVFAGDGVVYNYVEAGFPNVKMLINQQSDNEHLVLELLFAASAVKQPFSLPCDISYSGTLLNQGTICTRVPTANPDDTDLLCSDSDVSRTSDLRLLEDGKGYVIKLNNALSTYKAVMQNCNLANRELPMLKFGWNLIGVTGYEPINGAELLKKLPQDGSLTKLKELRADGQTVDVVTATNILNTVTLRPGKAYWVGVE
ncbi:MAG: hypothetical protein ABIH82_03280 [Candidatus Woesearchaeota archaeon]